jgi:hypothetical protein
MLKAIWPSIAHLPNHLPPSANITTSGARQLVFISWTNAHEFRRNDLLLSLLVLSVPIYVRLSAQDTLAIFGQIDYSSAHMDSVAYLGDGQSTLK